MDVSDTSQELLGATFPAGAGQGHAGGAGRALVLGMAGTATLPGPACALATACTSLCCNRNGSHWSDTPQC